MIPLAEEHGWKAPPARPVNNGSGRTRLATAEDITRSTWVKEGDLIGPAGLYRGDRDMFTFLVNDDTRVDDGSDGGISRGFIVRNSEVGAAAFSYIEFGFKNTCSNHIVWGVSDMKQIKIRHVGANAYHKAFQQLQCKLVEYVQKSAEEDELVVKKAKRFMLGQDKEEVLDFLFGKRLMSRALAGKAFDSCVQFEQGLDPRGLPPEGLVDFRLGRFFAQLLSSLPQLLDLLLILLQSGVEFVEPLDGPVG